MHFLLSNDDGFLAPGLIALAAKLAELGTVTVVAPERNMSGASNSLTLDRPLLVKRAENGFYYVNGTPTDCVHLAVTGMLEKAPDWVIAGVNLGPNMGDDTIYSGTVAAAMEGFQLGVPAIAISLASFEGKHFATAAEVACGLIERLCASSLPMPMLFNVNVPDLPASALRGIEITRLGRRHKAEPVVKQVSPRGDVVYWVGAAGQAADAGPGTDFYAVEQGFASVTPLQTDLTDHARLAQLSQWWRP
ncbi:MAG: 5'/3'-nucleotidase SurE [Rhodocyclaceae bacterium]|nr:5'/3'-nucleotidase SurE [Rhodocyclaceae bacterium]